MSLSFPYSSDELIYRLGWMLIHTLWLGTAMAALFAVAMAALRRRSARLRYVVGCVAMVAFMTSAVAALALSTPPTQPVSQVAADGIASHAEVASHSPLTVVPVKHVNLKPQASPTHARHVESVAATPENRPAAPVLKQEPPFLSRAAQTLEPALPWLVLVWTIGVCILALWQLAGWIAAGRLRRLSVHSADAGLVALAGRLAGQLGLRRAVKLLESALVRVPTVIGWLRPVILLPLGFATGLTPAQVESILVHELSHIRRYDYLVNLLQSLVETLLFYHPATWYISRRIRIEREHCCDDLALAIGANRRSYAESLLHLAQRSKAHGRRGLAPAGMTATGKPSELRSRVGRVLGAKEETSRMARSWPVVIVLGAIAIASSSLMMTLNAQSTDSSSPKTMPATQPAGGTGLVRAGQSAVTVRTVKGQRGKVDLGFTNRRPKGDCSLAGNVTSEKTGKPVAGALVHYFCASTHDSLSYITGRDGVFEFKDIPDGLCSLIITAPGYQRTYYNPKDAPGQVPFFTLKQGQRLEDLAIKVKDAYRLSGRVLDENGKPLAANSSVGVAAWAPKKRLTENDSDFEIVAQAQLEFNGDYAFDSLDARPVYVTTIDWQSADKVAPYPIRYYGDTFDRASAKLVKFGEKTSIDAVNIRLSKKGGLALEGTVTHSDTGKPVADALVVAHHGDMMFDRVTTYTDSKGKYRLECLGSGDILVNVDATPFGLVRQCRPVKLDSDPNSPSPVRLDVALNPGVKLSGRFVDASGKAIDIGPSAYGQAITKVDPNRHLPDGTYSGVRNRFAAEVKRQSPIFYASQEGDYNVMPMDFPTSSTFTVAASMAGDVWLDFEPKTLGVRVTKILRGDKEVRRPGISAKPGEVIDNLTIVIEPDAPATQPATAAGENGEIPPSTAPTTLGASAGLNTTVTVPEGGKLLIRGKEVDRPADGKIRVRAADGTITPKNDGRLHAICAVVDADTGKDVSGFRIIWGDVPGWNWFRFRSLDVVGGRLDATPPQDLSQYKAFRIRIEAAGYTPQVSGAFENDGKTHTFAFRLKKGRPVKGMIVRANGKPAKDLKVYLGRKYMHVPVDNGKVYGDDRFYVVTKTDVTGRFEFWPQEDEFTVLAVDNDGYVHVDGDQMADKPLTLQKWSKVRGVAVTGKKPISNTEVRLMTGMDRMFYDGVMWNISGKTDSTGHFGMDYVPQGLAALSVSDRMLPIGSIAPGKTYNVTLGGGGRTVTGKALPTAGYTFTQGWLSLKEEDKGPNPIPEKVRTGTLQDRKRWQEAWEQSAKGRAWWREYYRNKLKLPTYRFAISPDGSFVVEDVLPGEYEFRVRTNRGDPGMGCDVTVKGNDTKPQELGPLEVKSLFKRTPVTTVPATRPVATSRGASAGLNTTVTVPEGGKLLIRGKEVDRPADGKIHLPAASGAATQPMTAPGATPANVADAPGSKGSTSQPVSISSKAGIEMLKSLQKQHLAAIKSIHTWKGQAVKVKHSVGRGGADDYEYKSTSNVEFAVDLQKDMVRWNQKIDLNTWIKDGKEVPADRDVDIESGTNSGMVVGKLNYRYTLRGMYMRKGVPAPLLLIRNGRPETDWSFDPRRSMYDYEAQENLKFLCDNFNNPKLLGKWTIARSGNLVTVECRFGPNDINLNRYVFDTSRGSHLSRYYGEGDIVKASRDYTYEMLDGVWVPLSLVDKVLNVRGNNTTTSIVTVNWYNGFVNKALDADEFTVEKLGVKAGDVVQNAAAGKPPADYVPATKPATQPTKASTTSEAQEPPRRFTGVMNERVAFDGGANRVMFIDLDTGRIWTPAFDLKPQDPQKPLFLPNLKLDKTLSDWVRIHGIDLAVQTDGRTVVAQGLDMRLGKPLPVDAKGVTEDLTPVEVAKRTQDNNTATKSLATTSFSFPAKGDWVGSDRYPFVTREGGVGTLDLHFDRMLRRPYCVRVSYQIVRGSRGGMVKGEADSLASQRLTIERGLLAYGESLVHVDADGAKLRVSTSDAQQQVLLENKRLRVYSGSKQIAEATCLDTGQLRFDAAGGVFKVSAAGASHWRTAEFTWGDGRLKVKLKDDEGNTESREGVSANVSWPNLDVTVYQEPEVKPDAATQPSHK